MNGPSCSKSPYCRYRIMMYISVIELEIGVPVANTMPCPPVSSSMYMHFMYMSLAFWLSVWEIPATRVILVVTIAFLK